MAAQRQRRKHIILLQSLPLCVVDYTCICSVLRKGQCLRSFILVPVYHHIDYVHAVVSFEARKKRFKQNVYDGPQMSWYHEVR